MNRYLARNPGHYVLEYFSTRDWLTPPFTRLGVNEIRDR